MKKKIFLTKKINNLNKKEKELRLANIKNKGNFYKELAKIAEKKNYYQQLLNKKYKSHQTVKIPEMTKNYFYKYIE